ncbi:MAG TPA: cupin domain-containing protein [Verrucomicrobiae bacterium]|nr:cupin domain-containing protein [Verrucomicrobiae bacterium]
MTSKRFLLLLVPFLALITLAGAPSPDSGVIHIDHDKVAAVFARGGPLLNTNNLKVLALRRDGPGEVEIHEHDTDVLYVLEGSATLVTGGRPNEPRVTSPGETRAGSITGGVDRQLAKGDVMVIPNGVPHWFKEVKPPFLYFMVKAAQ